MIDPDTGEEEWSLEHQGKVAALGLYGNALLVEYKDGDSNHALRWIDIHSGKEIAAYGEIHTDISRVILGESMIYVDSGYHLSDYPVGSSTSVWSMGWGTKGENIAFARGTHLIIERIASSSSITPIKWTILN